MLLTRPKAHGKVAMSASDSGGSRDEEDGRRGATREEGEAHPEERSSGSRSPSAPSEGSSGSNDPTQAGGRSLSPNSERSGEKWSEDGSEPPPESAGPLNEEGGAFPGSEEGEGAGHDASGAGTDVRDVAEAPDAPEGPDAPLEGDESKPTEFLEERSEGVERGSADQLASEAVRSAERPSSGRSQREELGTRLAGSEGGPGPEGDTRALDQPQASRGQASRSQSPSDGHELHSSQGGADEESREAARDSKTQTAIRESEGNAGAAAAEKEKEGSASAKASSRDSGDKEGSGGREGSERPEHGSSHASREEGEMRSGKKPSELREGPEGSAKPEGKSLGDAPGASVAPDLSVADGDRTSLRDEAGPQEPREGKHKHHKKSTKAKVAPGEEGEEEGKRNDRNGDGGNGGEAGEGGVNESRSRSKTRPKARADDAPADQSPREPEDAPGDPPAKQGSQSKRTEPDGPDGEEPRPQGGSPSSDAADKKARSRHSHQKAPRDSPSAEQGRPGSAKGTDSPVGSLGGVVEAADAVAAEAAENIGPGASGAPGGIGEVAEAASDEWDDQDDQEDQGAGSGLPAGGVAQADPEIAQEQTATLSVVPEDNRGPGSPEKRESDREPTDLQGGSQDAQHVVNRAIRAPPASHVSERSRPSRPSQPPRQARPSRQSRAPRAPRAAPRSDIDVEGVHLSRDDASLGARGRIPRATPILAESARAAALENGSSKLSAFSVTSRTGRPLPPIPERDATLEAPLAEEAGQASAQILGRTAYDLLTSDRKCGNISPQSRRLRKSALEGKDEYIMLLYMERRKSLTDEPEFDAARAPRLDLRTGDAEILQEGDLQSQAAPLSASLFEKLSHAADPLPGREEAPSAGPADGSPEEHSGGPPGEPPEDDPVAARKRAREERARLLEGVRMGRTRGQKFYTPIVPMYMDNSVFAQPDAVLTGEPRAASPDFAAGGVAETGRAPSPERLEAYSYYATSRYAHRRADIYSEMCDPEKAGRGLSPQSAGSSLGVSASVRSGVQSDAQVPPRAISPMRLCRPPRIARFGIGTPTDPEHFLPGKWAPLKPLTGVAPKKKHP